VSLLGAKTVVMVINWWVRLVYYVLKTRVGAAEQFTWCKYFGCSGFTMGEFGGSIGGRIGQEIRNKAG